MRQLSCQNACCDSDPLHMRATSRRQLETCTLTATRSVLRLLSRSAGKSKGCYNKDLGGGESTLRSAACFACICVGRRDHVVPEDPLHSMRVLFPGVPVVGFLGNGEFGELGACGCEDEAGAGGDNDEDDRRDQERSEKRKRAETFQHALTFAFGFLTLSS